MSYAKVRRIECESTRWLTGIDKTAELLPVAKTIHIADREADDYALMCGAIERNARFVFRESEDRRLDAEKCGHDKLMPFLSKCQEVCTRCVCLSAHGKKTGHRKGSKAREQRDALLSFRAGTVVILRPGSQDKKLPKTIRVNVVHVVEVKPPARVEPIEWILFTTEPIESEEHVLRVVDFYRARWVIEEYFKSLKTGCAYLARQLESRTTLFNALAILIPIAWNLLRMRSISRRKPDTPAAAVITERQATILQNLPATRGMQLDSVRDAMLAVARLGGHLKHNGAPGWQTLARGYEDLLKTEVGYRLAELQIRRQVAQSAASRGGQG